ncbi:MAG: hypothetical protein AB1782_00795 [Cyanobacteriota bacterium]
MKKLSVAEYAKMVGKNESTIRRAIQAGRLHAIKEVVNNRPVYKIPVGMSEGGARASMQDNNEVDALVHEAEIIGNQNQYAMVSMEQSSFDDLINQFTVLSNARAETMQKSLEDTKNEYFELKAEYSTMHNDLRTQIRNLEKEIMQEKIKAAQIEAESKIKEIHLKEMSLELEKIRPEYNKLKEKFEKINNALIDCENQMQTIVIQKADLQSDLDYARETIDKLEKQNTNAIEEAQEIEKENNELKEQIEKYKNKPWWKKINKPKSS